MYSDGISADLIGMCIVGLGGSLLGLMGLLAGPGAGKGRGKLVGPLVVLLLAGTAGAAAALGQPSPVWLPILVLAGVCGLFHASRLPQLSHAGCTVLAVLRKPRLQWALLLAASPLLTLGWALLSEPECPCLQTAEVQVLAERPPTEELTVTAHAATDTGYPVPLSSPRSRTHTDPRLLTREEALVQPWTASGQLLRTAPPDGKSNCHGWVFTGGRYWVKGAEVERILQDNDYRPVTRPVVGDVIIYRNGDGQVTHSGLVKIAEEGRVLVESKWGRLGCYLHYPDKQIYGKDFTYYRSPRSGHHLRGLDAASVKAAS